MKKPSFRIRNDGFFISLREMTIPRNDVLAPEPSTKKTVGIDRFHKVFRLMLTYKNLLDRT